MAVITAVMVLAGCTGFAKKGKKQIVLTLWHVYGGQTDSPLNKTIDNFNETVGKEEGIRINVTSVTNTNTIHEAVIAAAKNEPGAAELPDIFVSYPKTVLSLPDKDILVDIAKYRSGNFSETSRSEANSDLNKAARAINVVLENYPDLKSQDTIRDAMQQNSYLQREITAARTLYNDAVNTWNREIFEFPFKKIVAAKEGRTTRIPFIAEKEIKDRSKGVFF